MTTKLKWRRLDALIISRNNFVKRTVEFSYKDRFTSVSQPNLSPERSKQLGKVMAGILNDHMERLNYEMEEWVNDWEGK